MNFERFLLDIKKIPALVFSFALYGFAISMQIDTNIGLAPWGVFHQGISQTTGLPFGFTTQLVGIIIVIITLLLKVYPGIGTILNVILIGFFVDLFQKNNWTEFSDNIVVRIILANIAAIMIGYASYLYIKQSVGVGPRDGLFIALIDITKWRVGYVRVLIEGSVFVIGFILGGSIGIGTLIAVFLGPIYMDVIFNFFNYKPKRSMQDNLLVYFRK